MKIVNLACCFSLFAWAVARDPCVDPSHLQCTEKDLRWPLTPLLVRLRGVDYVQQITNGCYKPSRQCDDWLDCRDGSDEHNCINRAPSTVSTTTSTSTTTTTANPTSRCHWDNYVPCRNGSRSLDPDNEICIKSTWLCDGTFDCLDHSDEEDCTTVTTTTLRETTPTTTTTTTTTAKLTSSTTAKTTTKSTTRYPTTRRTATPWTPAPWTPAPWTPAPWTPPRTQRPRTPRPTTASRSRCHRSTYTHCPSGRRARDPNDYICIKKTWLCDGVENCENGSDEWVQTCGQVIVIEERPCPPRPHCPAGMTLCPYGAWLINDHPDVGSWPDCMWTHHMCNGYVSCQGETDEHQNVCRWNKRNHLTLGEQVVSNEERARYNMTSVKRSC